MLFLHLLPTWELSLNITFPDHHSTKGNPSMGKGVTKSFLFPHETKPYINFLALSPWKPKQLGCQFYY